MTDNEVAESADAEPPSGPAQLLAVLNGQALRYLDVGAGRAVLLVHGLLGSSRHWTAVAERLAPEFRVIAPDLFGHGASAKPMGDYSLGSHAASLRDLLDVLGIDRITVVGHSLGGGIALQFAYLFPERVERIALVSSGGLGRELSLTLRAATLPGAEVVLPVLASSWVQDRTASLGRLLAKVRLRPSPDVAEAWRGIASLNDAESRRAFLATTRAVIDWGGQTVSAVERLALIGDLPTLLIWGARDPIIPYQHAIAANQAIEGSHLEIFERSGHFPQLDDPTRFARVLRGFMLA
jgi:pimeloyl-ACP methyl ester carboxylesterase